MDHDADVIVGIEFAHQQRESGFGSGLNRSGEISERPCSLS